MSSFGRNAGRFPAVSEKTVLAGRLPLSEDTQTEHQNAHAQQRSTGNTGSVEIKQNKRNVKTDNRGGVENHMCLLHS